jgi:LysR family transcriptional activator of glutamate synthase operon
MDILKLQYFVVVAKCQSMTKAAEVIHVAQPAISQAIRKLNDELGVKLFIRVGRNITLSETGKLFYSKVEPLVRELDEIPYVLAREVGLEKKTVRVSILSGQDVMIDTISEYKKHNPEVIFKLLQDDEDTDWDVRSTSLFDADRSDCFESLASEQICLAVPVDSDYCECDTVKLRDIKHADFITLDKGKQFSEITESYCLLAGFEPMVVFEAHSPEMIAKLVAAGVGISFWLPETWGRPDEKTVKLLDIEDVDCQWTMYLERGNKLRDNEVKQDFFNYAVGRSKTMIE